jgi:hypothetical protein
MSENFFLSHHTHQSTPRTTQTSSFSYNSVIYFCPSHQTTYVENEVTLRLMVSQSVCLGIKHPCGTCDQILLLVGMLCLKFAILFLWGAFSDKRTGVQFAVQSLNGPSHAEPVTILYCLIWDYPNLEGQVPVFISPRNRVAQGTGFALSRLLRIAGLWWRYFNSPPTWRAWFPYIYFPGTRWSSPKSKSRYHRWSVNQYVLVSSPRDFRGAIVDRILIQH